jgi:hypothetical protein
MSVKELISGLEKTSDALTRLQAGALLIDAFNGDPVVAKTAGFLANLAIEAGVKALVGGPTAPFLVGYAGGMLVEKGLELTQKKLTEEFNEYKANYVYESTYTNEGVRHVDEGTQMSELIDRAMGLPSYKYQYLVDPEL